MEELEVKKGVESGPSGNIIYARSGMGKTTFLGDYIKDADNGIFFQCGENSLRDLNPEWTKDIPNYAKILGGGATLDEMSDKWLEFKEILKFLIMKDHGYTDIAFDSFDNLISDNLAAYVNKTYYGGNIAKANAYGGSNLKEMYQELSWITQAFRYLQDKKGITIFLSMHAQTINFRDPSEPDYKKWSLSIPAREDYNLRSLLINWSSNTFFGTMEVDVDNKKATGGKHILKTNDGVAWEAKRRFAFPDIIDFTYAAFKKAASKVGK